MDSVVSREAAVNNKPVKLIVLKQYHSRGAVILNIGPAVIRSKVRVCWYSVWQHNLDCGITFICQLYKHNLLVHTNEQPQIMLCLFNNWFGSGNTNSSAIGALLSILLGKILLTGLQITAGQQLCIMNRYQYVSIYFATSAIGVFWQSIRRPAWFRTASDLSFN